MNIQGHIGVIWKDGQYSKTRDVEESRQGFEDLLTRLETGRKNQIRVHSADMGHPVCGDVKYGNGDDPLHRLCLHAYKLYFHHPVTHKPMEFETPIPSSFGKLFV